MTPPTQTLPTGTWTIDPDETTITVTAKKLGVITVPATLTATSGSIEIDADHRVAAVEVVADARSYTSSNAKRDTHVRSADFLDADAHPNLVFTAERVDEADAGYAVAGSVRVKAQSCPITVEIRDVDIDAGRGSFTATATLDRSALGVDKLPAFVIGRRLELVVTGRAVASDA